MTHPSGEPVAYYSPLAVGLTHIVASHDDDELVTVCGVVGRVEMAQDEPLFIICPECEES
jgi:hypothetical protein